MPKKVIAFLLLFSFLVFTSVGSVEAATPYSVYFNWIKLDVKPVTYKGKLYFNAKEIFLAAKYKY